jgi:hypothetical protein
MKEPVTHTSRFYVACGFCGNRIKNDYCEVMGCMGGYTNPPMLPTARNPATLVTEEDLKVIDDVRVWVTRSRMPLEFMNALRQIYIEAQAYRRLQIESACDWLGGAKPKDGEAAHELIEKLKDVVKPTRPLGAMRGQISKETLDTVDPRGLPTSEKGQISQ